jgi:hypothetical protein
MTENVTTETANGPWGSIDTAALADAVPSQEDAALSKEARYLRAVLTVFYIKAPMSFLAATVGASIADETINGADVLKWWQENQPSDDQMKAIEAHISKMENK